VQDWQSIVDKHGPMVWKIAYRLLADYQDAQDCFQETFVAALKLSASQPVRNFHAVLARIASARAIDRLRRRYRREPDGSAGLEDLASTHAGPDERASSAELAERLRRALAQLPPQEAEIFCLRCLNDLSYRHIAAMTGMKSSTVGQRFTGQSSDFGRSFKDRRRSPKRR